MPRPFRPGLASVTFRRLAPREIVGLAASCGLEGIEWGGDVHVPSAARATEVRRMTEDAGLAVAGYGSYWRAESLPLSGGGGQGGGSFEDTLDAALALGAPTIRVWAGARGSAEEDDRAAAADALRHACELAHSAGMTISLEWHDGTLTDTLASALRLVRRVDHPALRLYWQPNPARTHAKRLDELRAVCPWLSNLHVFQWTREAGRTVRRPLADGEAEWRDCLATVQSGDLSASSRIMASPLGEGRVGVGADGRSVATAATTPSLPFPTGEGQTPRYALLEFVPEDDPARLSSEAATLRRLLAEAP